jgi:putative oxidoreductase
MLQNLFLPSVFAPVAVAIFLAITFLQSGLDKAFNFADNLSWFQSHFSKTFLRSWVHFLLAFITLIEVVAGSLCAIGAILIVFSNSKTIATYGAEVAAISVLLLFFGQRIAKDYAGAASLVPYFLMCIGAVLLFNF